MEGQKTINCDPKDVIHLSFEKYCKLSNIIHFCNKKVCIYQLVTFLENTFVSNIKMTSA